MRTLTGVFKTEKGAAYLQQLCKHFGHKIEVQYDDTQGVCHFDMGPAHLTADPTGLTVRFELAAAEDAEMARNVIDRHLERFAFREAFKGMDWTG